MTTLRNYIPSFCRSFTSQNSGHLLSFGGVCLGTLGSHFLKTIPAIHNLPSHIKLTKMRNFTANTIAIGVILKGTNLMHSKLTNKSIAILKKDSSRQNFKTTLAVSATILALEIAFGVYALYPSLAYLSSSNVSIYKCVEVIATTNAASVDFDIAASELCYALSAASTVLGNVVDKINGLARLKELYTAGYQKIESGIFIV